MSVQLFMVWHQVVILLYLLCLFDKSVVFSGINFWDSYWSLMKNSTLYLPFNMFFQYFLSCAKEYMDYFIIRNIYYLSMFTFENFENWFIFPRVANAFCKTRGI